MKLEELLPTYSEQPKLKYKYTFTIFTPVYNRADTLYRVFSSLNAQTYRNFELVIINDGSTDNSHQTALDLIKTSTFKVNYINNRINRHKMACFFQAIQVAKGEFILPFDSDDECMPNALKTFYDEYQNIADDIKHKISGITCLCQDQFRSLLGNRFPEQPYFSNTFIRTLKNPNDAERWGFTKTQILKGINISEHIYSKGYIPEGIIWEFISKLGYETKYINVVLRTYYMDTKNRVSNVDFKKDSFGMAIYSLAVLNWFYMDYFRTNPRHFIKRIYTLLRASRFLNFKRVDYKKAFESKVFKILFVIGWPFKHLLK